MMGLTYWISRSENTGVDGGFDEITGGVNVKTAGILALDMAARMKVPLNSCPFSFSDRGVAFHGWRARASAHHPRGHCNRELVQARPFVRNLRVDPKEVTTAWVIDRFPRIRTAQVARPAGNVHILRGKCDLIDTGGGPESDRSTSRGRTSKPRRSKSGGENSTSYRRVAPGDNVLLAPHSMCDQIAGSAVLMRRKVGKQRRVPWKSEPLAFLGIDDSLTAC